MEVSVSQLYLGLLYFLISVVPCSCYSYCYYYSYSGYRCSYYYYYGYWDTPRTTGAAVGGGISLIVAIVVLIVLCRYCRGRQGFRGTTYSGPGQSVTTVTNASAMSASTTPSNLAYYPQQPYIPQQPQQPYNPQQPQQSYPQQYTYGQPQAQQPMPGYSNEAFSPPSYEQAAYQTKPAEQPSAPIY